MAPNPSRKAKCGKSDGKQPVKKNTGKKPSTLSVPKKRNVKPSERAQKKKASPVTPKRAKKTPKRSRPIDGGLDLYTPDSRDRPSTSFAKSSPNKPVKPCAFYKVTKGEDGKPIFSKELLRYFMKVDSPAADDLKNKRFNTSFLRETPRGDRDIQIFTPEEDNDPKYLENVPVLDFDMPNIPGSGHTHAFDSIPLKFDEEFNEFCRKKKSTRVTAFKGKPLPDQALTVDYSNVLDIIPRIDYGELNYNFGGGSGDDDEDDDDDFGVKSTEIEETSPSSDEESVNGKKRIKRSDILYSFSRSLSDTPVRPHGFLHPSQSDDLFCKKKDEMLLNKYKDIMGNRQLGIVLTRLPIDAELSEWCKKKNLKLQSTIDINGKEKGSEIEVPNHGLSKLQK